MGLFYFAKPAPSQEKSILWFDQISKEDVPIVGGKGANLGEMKKAGLPVPDGFVVTAEVYFYFIENTGIKKLISQKLSSFSGDDTKKLNSLSKEIKQAILKTSMPEKIAQYISIAYDKLCQGQEKFVAVRSSATAEDLPEASFAGQQATFLNQKGAEQVIKATQKCWASLFEPRAIFYRAQNNFDHLKVGIAVPIQLMIQSDASGVMFSVEPVTGDKNKIVIEAGFGLGEAIVSGSITPDRYLVDKNNFKILEKEIAKQEWKIVKVGEVDKHVTVPKTEQKNQKITDSQIIEIAKLGKKIEEHYGQPQDIEWAVDQDKIYIVQSRPVTALKEKEVKTESSKEIAIEAPKAAPVSHPADEPILKGAAASIGVAAGPVVVIHSAKEIDKVKEGDVLVTEMTNPEYVPAMKRAVAIVTDTGGRTSHAAIVSRELGIPCVVGTGSATAKLKTGDTITVDGSKGLIYEGQVDGLKAEVVPEEIKTSTQAREEVPITGTKVYVNLAEKELADKTSQLPCDGVGLLRAEFMIADMGEHPRAMMKKGQSQEFVEKLSEGMATFARAFAPRPVVYRAIDFKTNEYKKLKGGEKFEKDEANPMIGYRGALRYLKEPDLFGLELEAIKKVRQKEGLKNLWLMIPFVRTLEELAKIKDMILKAGLEQGPDFKLWLMVEVPSTVILIEKFCDLGIDGVSIGSNDLTQLILGADRDNPALAEEFDERNEAVVWAMRHTIEVCRQKGVTSSICGQAPSIFPEITEIFVEAGATSVSVNPDMIIPTRKLIASVEQKLALKKMERLENEIEGIEKKLADKKEILH